MGEKVQRISANQLSFLILHFVDAVFNYRSQYWIWSPILGSFCGGVVACFIYDVFVYLGPESPINTPCVIAFLPHFFQEITLSIQE